jgi:hypothetical protein
VQEKLTAVNVAAVKNRLEALQLLIESGAGLDIPDKVWHLPKNMFRAPGALLLLLSLLSFSAVDVGESKLSVYRL